MIRDYYGTKRITAWSMALKGKPGYAVKYEDGYISWSPQDVFEAAYQPLDKLSFGHALVALEKGQRVARAGWDGKGMWLFQVRNWSIVGECYGDRPTEPFIAMKTANGGVVAWLASQTDMLAKDWTIVEASCS